MILRIPLMISSGLTPHPVQYITGERAAQQNLRRDKAGKNAGICKKPLQTGIKSAIMAAVPKDI
jgi:hypothetical protein